MHPGHHRRHAGGQEGAARLCRRRARERSRLARLLLDLKRRGLSMAPKLAVADGALGFWKAIGEVWPKTGEQRCWVHKTANILNKLPKSQQPKAKRMLQDIWMAETRKDAEAAFDAFVETYGVKYEKAAECLKKDRDPLLAFYDFRAEHWKHLRTSNPIESTFATVRHRTIRSKGCLSNKTALAMVFKLRLRLRLSQLDSEWAGVPSADFCLGDRASAWVTICHPPHRRNIYYRPRRGHARQARGDCVGIR